MLDAAHGLIYIIENINNMKEKIKILPGHSNEREKRILASLFTIKKISRIWCSENHECPRWKQVTITYFDNKVEKLIIEERKGGKGAPL